MKGEGEHLAYGSWAQIILRFSKAGFVKPLVLCSGHGYPIRDSHSLELMACLTGFDIARRRSLSPISYPLTFLIDSVIVIESWLRAV